MKQLDWDCIPGGDRRIKGPKIVPISEVVLDPALVHERTVKRFVESPSTQEWYFEPITCVQLPNGKFEANGLYAHDRVEACSRLGYKTLQIVWLDKHDKLNPGRQAT